MRRLYQSLVILLLSSTLAWGAEPKANKIRVDDAGSYYTSTSVEGALQEVGPVPFLFTTTEHYSGFPDRTSTSLSWNDGSYTLSLTASSDDIYISGVKYTINTLTKQIPDTTGLYWFWLEKSGANIVMNAGNHPGFGKCLVATVYWNTTTNKGIIADERHWMGRDQWWHEYTHETIGARYASGLAGTFADATITIGLGEFYDEDIEHETEEETVCTVLYHNGDANWAWDSNSSVPYKVVGGGDNNLRYNNGNALATVDNNKYVNYWVFITGDTVDPVHVYIGTAQYATIALARAASLPSLGSLSTAEEKIIFKITYQNNGGTPDYIEATDYRSSSNLPSTSYVATDHGSLAGLSDDDHPQYIDYANTTIGNILVSDGSNFQAVAMSGEATVASTGAIDVNCALVTGSADLCDGNDASGSETNDLESVTTGILVDEVPIGTADNDVTYKVIADCNTAGDALNYDTTGHAFSCASGYITCYGVPACETDPVYVAWDKSTGISITESQISDFGTYLTAEVDGSTSNEIEVVDEAYSAANFNAGTTSAVSQDDFYDLMHIADTDDDGLPNKVDTATDGFVKTTNTDGTISIDTSTYLTAEVDGSTSNEIEVVDEAYSAANFNGGTTTAVSQDDLYDYEHISDADDDGKIDVVDLTAGFVKSDANGALSADTNTYLTSETGDISAVGDCSTGASWTGACGTTLSSNTDIILALDEDANGTESFQVLDGANAIVAEVTEAGALQIDASLTIGNNAATDRTITFDASNDGVITYDESLDAITLDNHFAIGGAAANASYMMNFAKSYDDTVGIYGIWGAPTVTATDANAQGGGIAGYVLSYGDSYTDLGAGYYNGSGLIFGPYVFGGNLTDAAGTGRSLGKFVGAQLFGIGGYTTTVKGTEATALYVQPICNLGGFGYAGTYDFASLYGIKIVASDEVGGAPTTTADTEIMLNIELPTEPTAGYQIVLEGSGNFSGIWFNGTSGHRAYSDGTDFYITGMTSVGTTGPDLNYVSASGKIEYESSTRRIKKDIEPYYIDGSKFLGVTPKSWKYIESGNPDLGFVVEDLVEAGMSDAVGYDEKGQPSFLKKYMLIAYLLDLAKQQDNKIKNLESRIEKLEKLHEKNDFNLLDAISNLFMPSRMDKR